MKSEADRLDRSSFQSLFESLVSDDIIYFPIRHHSPACSWHLKHILEEYRPEVILIEGPSDLDQLIPFITDPRAVTPFAIYTTYVDKSKRVLRILEKRMENSGAVDSSVEGGSGKQDEKDRGEGKQKAADLRKRSQSTSPLRFAGYYPMCDYSPELVALREGLKLEADTRFIDLTYPEKVISEAKGLDPDTRAHIPQSLLQEGLIKRSAYVRRLIGRTGCRDQNELWDHLFEVRYREIGTREFMENIAAYCFMARKDYPAQVLEQEGTTAREHAMAASICETMRERNERDDENDEDGCQRPILVVTGGFHTVALPDLVRQMMSKKPKRKGPGRRKWKPGPDEAQTVLMRYSFDRLDALNGYASGMPSPEYYQKVWSGMTENGEEERCEGERNEEERNDEIKTEVDGKPFVKAARDILVTLGHTTREKFRSVSVSASEEIEAYAQIQRLAQLRGNPEPTRDDMLDSIRSCFVKGSMDIEGSLVMAAAMKLLTGDRVGALPPEVGVPPIVDDFNVQARAYRLEIDSTSGGELTMDIYRKPAHRMLSRFLHSLCFLNVPFAVQTGGPDFVLGKGLNLINEQWNYGWTHVTESTIIECSRYGSTIAEAAASLMEERILDLRETGEQRDAMVAARFLVSAFRMGLHGHILEIVDLLSENIHEDASFGSLAGAVGELFLLHRSREPLEADRFIELPELITEAYRKACYLISKQRTCPEEEEQEVLKGLTLIRELVTSIGMDLDENSGPDSSSILLDGTLFHDNLAVLASGTERMHIDSTNAAVIGGATGILHGDGKLEEDDFLMRVNGFLGSAVNDPRIGASFIRGLLYTSRELTWQHEEFIRTLDSYIGGWEEDRFMSSLPDLRLAFSDLTPREIDRVAHLVSKKYDRSSVQDILKLDKVVISGMTGRKLNEMMTQILTRDGLDSWIQDEEQMREGRRATGQKGSPENKDEVTSGGSDRIENSNGMGVDGK